MATSCHMAGTEDQCNQMHMCSVGADKAVGISFSQNVLYQDLNEDLNEVTEYPSVLVVFSINCDYVAVQSPQKEVILFSSYFCMSNTMKP